MVPREERGDALVKREALSEPNATLSRREQGRGTPRNGTSFAMAGAKRPFFQETFETRRNEP